MTGCDLEHRPAQAVARNFWRSGGLYKYYFGPVTGYTPGRARGFSPLLLHTGGSTLNEPPFFFGADEEDRATTARTRSAPRRADTAHPVAFRAWNAAVVKCFAAPQR